MSIRSAVVALCTTLLSSFPATASKTLPEAAPGPSSIGYRQALEVVPDLASSPPRGSQRVWTHSIRVDEAVFVKVHLVDVNLRAGDVLTVRSRTGHVVEEIRGRGPKNLGTFWTLSAYGDEASLELTFDHEYGQPPFTIDQIIVGDIDPFPGDSESVCTPADFEDVFCYQDDAAKWANVLASVGVMSLGGNPAAGALWCSGSNVSPTNRLLTNQHCIENQGDCNGAEFVFKYYRTGCGDGSPTTPDWVSFRCDQILAQSPYDGFCDPILTNLDYTLASVIGDPASTFGFVTPDPTPITSGEDIYIVQHPAGRPHEITHGGGNNVVVDGTTLRYYDTLDTEGGSSGSPIYREADDRLVGLHHCGGCSTPGTGNRGMLMSDIYPEIASHLCTQGVEVTAAGTEGLEEIGGNGDAVFDWGETWQFYPRVRNTACAGDAMNVRADVAPSPANGGTLTVLDPVATFGNIAAGATASSLSPIRFEIGSDFPCGDSFAVDLIDLQADGTSTIDVASILTGEIGEEVQTIFFAEHFGSGLGTWTVVDGGTGTGTASTWTDANPGNRALSLTEPFAIVDSDALGSGFEMDEELISDIIDLSSTTAVRLQFQHDFNWYASGQDEQADVDLRSTATGGSWVNVVNFSGGDASGLVDLDVTALAAGQSDVQLRFHYHQAIYEWWWAVDDVNLLDSEWMCGGASGLFADGFESGDTSAWSETQP